MDGVLHATEFKSRLATSNLLTFPEFKAKHKLKYSGLGNAQIRQRYDNYLSSSEPSRGLIPSGRVRQKNPFGGSAISMSQIQDPEWLASKGMVAPGVSLSAESTKYIGALTDPSNAAFIGAGYPQASQGPSLKSRFFVRGTMIVGTAGVGFAMFSPLSGMVNDQTCVAVSDQNYTGAKFPASANGIGVQNYSSNSTLTSIKGTAGRIVAASIKISPAGKLIDEAGIVTTISSPGGIGLYGVDASSIQTEWWRHAQVHEQPREGNRKFSALWTPTFPNLPFFNMANNDGILDRARANAGSGLVELVDITSMSVHNLGVIVEGATPGFVYYVEAYVHCEFFAGALVLSTTQGEDNVVTQHATPTYSDATAIDLVNSSNGVSLNALPKTDDGSSASSSVTEWLGNAAKGVTYFANAMKSLGSMTGSGGASQLMSSVGSSFPALDSSTSLESMGGFLGPAATVAEDSGPVVEMITEAGEFIPLLAL